jgi:hypothetical protein
MYGADEMLMTTVPCPTTPRIEFEFVMGLRECPPQQMVDSEGNTKRVIRPIAALQEERLTAKAGLKREEIVSVVRSFPIPVRPLLLLLIPNSMRLPVHQSWT